jgi:hypothetical protein
MNLSAQLERKNFIIMPFAFKKKIVLQQEQNMEQIAFPSKRKMDLSTAYEALQRSQWLSYYW